MEFLNSGLSCEVSQDDLRQYLQQDVHPIDESDGDPNFMQRIRKAERD